MMAPNFEIGNIYLQDQIGLFIFMAYGILVLSFYKTQIGTLRIHILISSLYFTVIALCLFGFVYYFGSGFDFARLNDFIFFHETADFFFWLATAAACWIQFKVELVERSRQNSVDDVVQDLSKGFRDLNNLDTILTSAKTPHKRKNLALDLVARSNRFRSNANLILSAIFLLIASGVLLIFFSGNIISGDVQSQSKTSRINAQIDQQTSKLDVLEASRDSLRKEFLAAKEEEGVLTIQMNSQEGTDKSATQIQVAKIKTKVDQLSGAEANIETKISAINEQIKQYENAKLDIISNDNGAGNFVQTNSNFLIASAVTRIGILLIVVFLVQILVGIYRYSMRMSAFYLSRADSLLLISNNANSLGAWEDSLLPKEIDFGKTPVSPAKEALDVVREALRK